MSYKLNILKGLKWTSSEQVIVAIIYLVRFGILARLLPTETFGLYAIIAIIQGVSLIFSDMGISSSLYHQKNIKKIIYSSLYWINIFINLVIYALFILAAPFIASFFKEPLLVGLIPIVGLNLIFLSIGKHFIVYARKELRFKQLSLARITTTFIALIMSILLAYSGFGIYALIIPELFVGLALSIYFFFIMRRAYPLEFALNIHESKSFIKIGLYQAGSEIMGFLAKQLDAIVIGRSMDMETLGIYNLIKILTMRMYALINSIMTKVAVPIFSTFNDFEGLLKQRYLNMVSTLALINAAVYSYAAFVAEEILTVLYGFAYSGYELYFILLCAVYLVSAVLSPAGVLVISKGKTQYGLYWVLFRIIFSIPLLYILGMHYGVVGIILGNLIFAAQALFSYFYVLVKRVQSNISLREHIGSFQKSLFFGIGVFALCFTIYSQIRLPEVILIRLVTKSIIYCIIAGLAFWLLFKEHFQFIRNRASLIITRFIKR